MPPRSTLSLGTVPAEEACAQLGVTPLYDRYAGIEAMVYRAALIATHGVPPEGVTIPTERCAHDFGTYTDLQLHYDPADVIAANYAERAGQGLARWIDAGFHAPCLYNDHARVVELVYRDHFEAARRVIVTLERQRIDGYGSGQEAYALANLRAIYPAQAAQADQLLRQIASEVCVRPPSARRVGLYAPYRLIFMPALFNDHRGQHYPKGDVWDVAAHELRRNRDGHRYIVAELGSSPTIDQALEICWEHLARYVIP